MLQVFLAKMEIFKATNSTTHSIPFFILSTSLGKLFKYDLIILKVVYLHLIIHYWTSHVLVTNGQLDRDVTKK